MCFATSLGLVVVTGALSQSKRVVTNILKFAVLCAIEVPNSDTGEDGHSEYEIEIGK